LSFSVFGFGKVLVIDIFAAVAVAGSQAQ